MIGAGLRYYRFSKNALILRKERNGRSELRVSHVRFRERRNFLLTFYKKENRMIASTCLYEVEKWTKQAKKSLTQLCL